MDRAFVHREVIKYNQGSPIPIKRKDEYELETRWCVPGRIDHVVEVFKDVEGFPLWWRPVFLSATVLEPGDDNGAGKVAQLTTRGFLPYVLQWQIEVKESREPFGFSFKASGHLVGRGEWTLQQVESEVRIELFWSVTLEKPMLRELSPLLKPLLVRNHRWAMLQGQRGLHAEVERRAGVSRSTARARIAAPVAKIKG